MTPFGACPVLPGGACAVLGEMLPFAKAKSDRRREPPTKFLRSGIAAGGQAGGPGVVELSLLGKWT
jgi:hypothetical protein